MFIGCGFGLGSSSLTELAFGGFIQDLPPPGALHTAKKKKKKQQF